MRKTILAGDGHSPVAEQAPPGHAWLDLNAIASVEISSEEDAFTVEQALTEVPPGLVEAGHGRRWQAAESGPQTIRLRFDSPQDIKRILLHFFEEKHERSQEFSLEATLADGHTRELIRQQWTFSPRGSVDQLESYAVDLKAVLTLTLWIDPDRGLNRYPATLRALRLEGGRDSAG